MSGSSLEFIMRTAIFNQKIASLKWVSAENTSSNESLNFNHLKPEINHNDFKKSTSEKKFQKIEKELTIGKIL